MAGLGLGSHRYPHSRFCSLDPHSCYLQVMFSYFFNFFLLQTANYKLRIFLLLQTNYSMIQFIKLCDKN